MTRVHQNQNEERKTVLRLLHLKQKQNQIVKRKN